MTLDPIPRNDDPAAWMQEALCAQIGGDGWFPDKAQPLAITVQDAKKVCNDCPVAAQCLQYAIDHDERYGIWGGLTPKQRDNLRQGKPRHTAVHGTDAMYRKGCHTDTDCPNSYTCAQAHRDQARAWDQKRRAEGRGRSWRKAGAA